MQNLFWQTHTNGDYGIAAMGFENSYHGRERTWCGFLLNYLDLHHLVSQSNDLMILAADGCMVSRGLCHLEFDGFVDPQCHLRNSEPFVCAVTRSFNCYGHDKCTSELLSPCQGLVPYDDIMGLGIRSLDAL
jgi:hypothetical protein